MRLKLILAATAAMMIGLAGAMAKTSTAMDSANVRSGPGFAWPVTGKISANGRVHILTCAMGNSRGWCKVSYSAGTGWVEASVLAPSGASRVKIAPFKTRYSAHVRNRPNLGSKVVGVIGPGEIVNVNNCTQGWRAGWCHVNNGRKSGYIRRSLLMRANAVLSHQRYQLYEH